ncbi:MAG: hypothetical protein AAF327_25380 [Cyanobacteria bacterium P01_A01_bin.37]
MELKARQKRSHEHAQKESGVDSIQIQSVTSDHSEAIAISAQHNVQMTNNELVDKDATAEQPSKPLEHSLQIQCNTLLYTTLQNMVMASHAAGDFRYTSVADVVREAIRSHKQGLPLTELAEKGRKRPTSIRIDQELLNHYKSWPKRLRSQILERVIRSYLKTL